MNGRVILVMLGVLVVASVVGLAVWDGSLSVDINSGKSIERIDADALTDALRAVDLGNAAPKRKRDEAEPTTTDEPNRPPVPPPAAPTPASPAAPEPPEPVPSYTDGLPDTYREPIPENP